MKKKLFAVCFAMATLSAVAIMKVTDSSAEKSLLLENAEALSLDELPDGWVKGYTMISDHPVQVGTEVVHTPTGAVLWPKYENLPCCVVATESDACNKGNADSRC